ncbi:MAG: flagellar hook-length control protein FliK [Chloroflexota bacterium]
MNINWIEALPVNKPPPETCARGSSPAAEPRRSDAPSFEETLRARQREDTISQPEAEAAVSQCVSGGQAPNSPPGSESPSGSGSANPPGTDGGLRLSATALGLLSEPTPPTGTPVNGMIGLVEQPAGEEAPIQPQVELVTVLDDAPDAAAQKAQVLASTGGEVENTAVEVPVSKTGESAPTNIKANPTIEAGSLRAGASPQGELNRHPQARLEMLQQDAAVIDHAQAHNPAGVPSAAAAGVSGTVAFSAQEEALFQNARLMADMVRQIANQMEGSIQNGRSSLRVQLHPQELGGIDIRFASNSQGISVTVFAEQASTGRLLEAQLNQLRQALNEAGVNLTQLNIHHQSQSHHQQGTFSGHQPHGRHGFNRAAGGESAPLLETMAGWRNMAANGVDYRV